MINLRPYPSVKDSGVLWVGSIPDHWMVLPNRVVFAEVKDRGYPDQQMLSVTINEGVIKQSTLLASTIKRDSSNEDKSKYKLVEVGDITYNKMRAWQGAIGVSSDRGIVSPAYIVMRLRGDSEPLYFHHLLRSPAFIKEAERWSYGISSDQWSLRWEDFKRIYCVVPPKDEQSQIAEFIRGFDLRMLSIIAEFRRLVGVSKSVSERKTSLLYEYRTRLIEDVTLGHLDVRGKMRTYGKTLADETPIEEVADFIENDAGGGDRDSEASLP